MENITNHKAIKISDKEWMCNGITITTMRFDKRSKRYTFKKPEAFLTNHPMETSRIYCTTLEACVAAINNIYAKEAK
jgi:hypothetical protein